MKSRYAKLKRNGKTLLAHREIAAVDIGRPLRSDEHVHHRNHDRRGNSPLNLEVKPALAHIREHADERLIHPRQKTCEVCGRFFTPHRTKRKRAKTCSRPCANKLRAISERKTKALVRVNLVEQQQAEVA